MTPPPRLLTVLIIGVVLGVAASLGFFVTRDRAPAETHNEGDAAAGTVAQQAGRPAKPLSPEQRRFQEVLDKVQRDYVDDVPVEKLLDAATRGMVSGLDPYSDYLDRREYEDLRRAATGNYPGIGIEVVADGDFIKVLRPLADSPALRAGIRKNDIILRIDDEPIGRDVIAAIEQMRGPPGSLVRLTLRRAGTDELVNVALERARVAVQSVSIAKLDRGYAYLRIAAFSETTPQEFEREIGALKAVGPLRGVVLDLRNNPGGVLEGAVAVADALLDRGVIVSGVGRSPQSAFRMTAAPGELLLGVPIVVLIDGTSASAAEILAGALKDHRRARLLGQRSYGKGSVQTVIPLADGHALKLTTARYATPSGALINGRGIEPDVRLPDSPMTDGAPSMDPQVQAALRELRRATPAKRVRS